MRIYLAARYSRRVELQAYRLILEQLGHEVTSRWVWEDHELAIGTPLEAGVRFAREDMVDLHRCECVISFTEEPGQAGGRNRGGRHVEFGIALASHHIHRIVVVGPRENVFHYLDQVEMHATWPEALAAIGPASPAKRLA